ncbi:hypothetical protein [Anaerotalea alkaliphila]|uniref:Peptidase C39-like domain-containing protein n=1 Tax=Anaerotalea alkaliphila TaxID=2662126 RepID=A0A7X5HTZ4_9FIRM|nr:hypothetical protein [Anaerotalea alkaliphila]NDL66623.1 hypothetical protein [Anaerotalea alkaliphila]
MHIQPSISPIDLSIWDGSVLHQGGSQYWFPRRFHQVSGCGPVAAANITAWLAQRWPERYSRLYPYGTAPFQKDAFVRHMVEIRKSVRPGLFGLTSVETFTRQLLAFAASRGVSLSHATQKDPMDSHEALSFIRSGLELQVPVAILVLLHPRKELDEYTWHWMTITDLRCASGTPSCILEVSSWGQEHLLDFDLLWNHRNQKKHKIHLGYYF